ncbi:MAG: DUF169 domain-containing protein [Chloroflexi bacterium]|nr:DUF169 domain-containing protein [Chloroflexota bacterium]
MPQSYAELSAFLEYKLQLGLQPIALAYVTEAPQDIPRVRAVAPSSCAFWRQAEVEVFYASAADHFKCPLGASVLGFSLPDQQTRELREELEIMCGMSYIRAAEVEHLPKVARSFEGIVYGALHHFPLEPDAVLLWVTPRQAMTISEACGLTNWASTPGGLLGRPACAAIPVAMSQGEPSVSLGCVGMRINTSIPEEFLLMVIPRNRLETLEDDLSRVARVHGQMEARYLERIDSA